MGFAEQADSPPALASRRCRARRASLTGPQCKPLHPAPSCMLAQCIHKLIHHLTVLTVSTTGPDSEWPSLLHFVRFPSLVTTAGIRNIFSECSASQCIQIRFNGATDGPLRIRHSVTIQGCWRERIEQPHPWAADSGLGHMISHLAAKLSSITALEAPAFSSACQLVSRVRVCTHLGRSGLRHFRGIAAQCSSQAVSKVEHLSPGWGQI